MDNLTCETLAMFHQCRGGDVKHCSVSQSIRFDIQLECVLYHNQPI